MCEKKAYEKLRAAREDLNFINKRHYHWMKKKLRKIYLCSECGKYHLTSQDNHGRVLV